MTFFFSALFDQMLDQAVKYLEDMQDDFDFRYKTLQLRGDYVAIITSAQIWANYIQFN